MIKESGLYMSILSGTLLLIALISCILNVIKYHRKRAESLPIDDDQVIKLKSFIYYCFGFSITFWLAPLDIILSSMLGIIVGIVSTTIISFMCPKLCNMILRYLNKKNALSETTL